LGRPAFPNKRWEDLRGKKGGVSSFGTTDFHVTKSERRNLGIDAENVVMWIAVHEGVMTDIALEPRSIDALADYDTVFLGIETTHIEIRYLSRPAKISSKSRFIVSNCTEWIKHTLHLRFLLDQPGRHDVGFINSLCGTFPTNHRNNIFPLRILARLKSIS
jgi:hypothetical protein